MTQMMSALDSVEALIQRVDNHPSYCDISANQYLPNGPRFASVLASLTSGNLYQIDIGAIHTQLEHILHATPIYSKFALLNQYLPHGSQQRKCYITPLFVFITLMRKLRTRSTFNTLWNILVLLLKHGAFPLLHSMYWDSESKVSIFSLQLVWNLYVSLMNFFTEETEVFQRIHFVLSFIDRFHLDRFSLYDKELHNFRFYNIWKQIPSIFYSQELLAIPAIPSPDFLHVLLLHGFPLFDTKKFNAIISTLFDIDATPTMFDIDALNMLPPHHLCLAKYHEFFFIRRKTEFTAIYRALEKEADFPLLNDGVFDAITAMQCGCPWIIKQRRYYEPVTDVFKLHEVHEAEYLYHTFMTATADWVPWSFDKLWKHKNEEQLQALVHDLSAKNFRLHDCSSRVRESACFQTMETFYLKLVSMQGRMDTKELSMWLRHRQGDPGNWSYILTSQTFDIGEHFMDSELFAYFWDVFCEKDALHDEVGFLQVHLRRMSLATETREVFVSNLAQPLYARFCKRFGSMVRMKDRLHLMNNMIKFVKELQSNGIEIANTYHGLKCLFDGACVEVFQRLGMESILTTSRIEEYNDSISVLFTIFRERGKHIQQRHERIMCCIGEWLSSCGYQNEVVEFVAQLISECQQITNNGALQQKRLAMIQRLQSSWN